MRFFRKSKDSADQKNSVLFVCVENAGRSQMAEGFFRKYSPEGYEPLSAGTRPVSSINPLAIEAQKQREDKGLEPIPICDWILTLPAR